MWYNRKKKYEAEAAQEIREKRLKKRSPQARFKSILALSLISILMFTTVYGLILNAITIDKDTAKTEPGLSIEEGENPAEEVPGSDEVADVEETLPETTAPEENTDPVVAGGDIIEETSGEAVAESEDTDLVESGDEETLDPEATVDGETDVADAEDPDAVTGDENETEAGDEDETVAGEETTAEGETVAADDENAETQDGDETVAAAGDEETTGEEAADTTEAIVDSDEDKETEAEEGFLVGELSFEEAGDYLVTMKISEDAQIPAGAVLAVSELSEEESAKYREQAQSTLEGESLVFARFFDIRIMKDGVEIEPAAPVEVSVQYAQPIEVAEDKLSLLHFHEDEEAAVIDAEVIGQENKVEEVKFEAEKFSVFGFVGSEEVTEPGEYVFKGDGYLVRVKIPEDAQLPEGTKLVVSEIDNTSDEYIQLLGQTWRTINKEYFEVQEMHENYNEGMGILPDVPLLYIDDARFFNISFVVNGEVIKPAFSALVDIELDTGLESNMKTTPGGVTYSVDGVDVVESVKTVSDNNGVGIFNYELDEVGNVGAYIAREAWEEFAEPKKAPAPVLRAASDYDDTEGEELRAGEDVPPLNPLTASKTLVPNKKNPDDEKGDGTYTLSLTVKGESQAVTNKTKANVLIIMDRSSSMVDNYAELSNVTDVTAETLNGPVSEGTIYYGREQHHSNYRYFPIWYNNGSWYCDNFSYENEVSGTAQYDNGRYTGNIESRLTAEQTALSSLLNSLLSNNTTTDPEIIEVSIISFGNTRFEGKATEVPWTTNHDDLMVGINKNTVTSGTNWEESLIYAKEIADAKKTEEPDQDLFVIFLTDGEPTAYSGETGGALHYDDVGGGFVAAYEPARNDALALVTAGYKLYGIFTYGSGEEQIGYLKRLINYSYSGGTNDTTAETAALSEYFYDAQNTAILYSAFENIVSSITNAVAYGQVQIQDGMTTDASVMTVVDGRADGFTYTVTGSVGELYSVTATGTDNPTVVFTIGGNNYTATKGVWPGTDPYDTSDDKEYYYVELGEGDDKVTYKMALAEIVKGQVTWDLSAIGTLMGGYTYTVSFVVWPNQEAYDYVAGLNNGLDGFTWNTGLSTYKDHTVTGEEYDIGGVAGFPSIVRYPNGTFSVLTNTDQSVRYYIANTTEVNGVETVTYDGPYTLPLDTPDPMDLEGTELSIAKLWSDSLDPSTIEKLIENANGNYSVKLQVYEGVDSNGDPKPYKLYSFEPVLDTETGQYNWPTQKISIAPAIMTTKHPGGSTVYPTVTFNGKEYYLLNEGHDYTIEEVENEDFHFEFYAVPYHPSLVDGLMTNLTLVKDGDNHYTATQVGLTPLETFEGINSLTAELDITKEIYDPNEKLTKEQEDAETFTYKVTLTVPYDPQAKDPDKYIRAITAYEYVPRPTSSLNDNNRFLVYGYQYSDNVNIQGLQHDVERFDGKVYGSYTMSYPDPDPDHEDHTLVDIFGTEVVNGTKTGVVYVTLKRNEIIRFTNLPTGTTYSIQEVYANLKQADPCRDADTVPEIYEGVNSNVAAQGYSVSIETKQGATTSTVNSDTVTGVISEPDTRYYNLFTNSLSDAAVVQLGANKHLLNYEWIGEKYYIKLKPDSGNHTLDRFTISQKQMYLSNPSGTADKSYQFTNWVRFAAPGEYVYFLDEMSGVQGSNNEYIGDPLSGTFTNGIYYDNQKKVIITVARVNGSLTITKIEDGDGHVVYSTDPNVSTTTGYVEYKTNLNRIITTFTNKVLPITLYKIGDFDTENAMSDVSFELYADEACTTKITEDVRGTDLGTLVEKYTYYIDEEKTEISEIETEYYDTTTVYDGVLKTSDDGTVRIGVLSAGTYYLKEIVTQDGYILLSELVTITIGSDGTVSYTQPSYNRSNSYTSASPAENLIKSNGGLFITGTDTDGNVTGYTITVNNSAGTELPETGGIGKGWFFILGGILLAGAGALLLMKKRNKAA